MLIYSMSVSVDGLRVDRPSEELFRFHLAQVRDLGGRSPTHPAPAADLEERKSARRSGECRNARRATPADRGGRVSLAL